jgi:hypothetical protein
VEDNRDFCDLPSTLSQRSTLLRGKPNYSYDNQVPGPASYSPQQLKGFKGYSYGKSAKNSEVPVTPGPSDYSPGVLDKSPAYTIAGKGQSKQIEMSPGPGSYDLPGFSTRSTFLRGKITQNFDNKVPGPGHYSPDNKFESLSFSQSRSNRFESINQTPGPGDFHQELPKQGPKFSFTGRPKESSEIASSSSPGPGSYEIKGTNSNIAFSLRGKFNPLPDAKVPGPGSYETSKRTGPNGFTVGKSSRTDFTLAVLNNPGPGHYGEGQSVDQRRSKSVQYSFSRATRDSHFLSESPGPGSYDPKIWNSPRAALLRGKPQDLFPNKTPVRLK